MTVGTSVLWHIFDKKMTRNGCKTAIYELQILGITIFPICQGIVLKNFQIYIFHYLLNQFDFHDEYKTRTRLILIGKKLAKIWKARLGIRENKGWAAQRGYKYLVLGPVWSLIWILLLYNLTRKYMIFIPMLRKYREALFWRKIEKIVLGWPWKSEKLPSRVGYFSKIAEILITSLAAQTTQKAESRTTKSLLMQDWVFRLGYLLILLNLIKRCSFT